MRNTTRARSSLVGDELLIAVFSHFPNSNTVRFRDESVIMRAFYDASKKSKYHTLFSNYHFDQDGVVPYSSELADGLDILQKSSLLGKLNPAFVDYQLSPAVRIRYNYVKSKLSASQISLVARLAKELQEEILPSI